MKKFLLIPLFLLGGMIFAENQFRFDMGLNIIMVPMTMEDVFEDIYSDGSNSDINSSFDSDLVDGAASSGIVLPVGDLGVYGQFNFGKKLRLGIGLRDLSVCLIANILFPSFYFEADAGPFTFDLSLGGGLVGALSLFASYYVVGPYFLPEASVWIRLPKNFRLGGGLIVGLWPEVFKGDVGANIGKASVFYLGAKYVIAK